MKKKSLVKCLGVVPTFFAYLLEFAWTCSIASHMVADKANQAGSVLSIEP